MQPQTTSVAGDPTAVMGRRIVAFLIDAGIGIALMVSLWFSVASSQTFDNSSQAEFICDSIQSDTSGNSCFTVGDQVWLASNSDTSMVLLVMLAYGVFFQFLLPGVAGYSIGKGIMGLRIVKHETGQLAGLGANGVRWILWIVDALPCYLVGLITGFASKGHRRVGDMAAGTVVVDKASVGVPLAIPGLSQPESAPAAWSPPPVSAPPSPSGWDSPPPGSAGAAPPPTPPPSPPQSAVPNQPPAFPPPSTPPLDSTPPPPGAPEPTTAMPDLPSAEAAPPAADPPSPPLPSAPTPKPEPEAQSQPGVEAPQWDQARNTYIQWDPELGQWMEWSENSGKWIPIST